MNQFISIVFLAGLASSILMSCSSKSISRQGAIDNFEKHEQEILALTHYFTNLKPDSGEVHFRPDGNRYTISIGLPNWNIIPDYPYKVGRNMKINSPKMDSLLSTLGWNTKTVLTLKEMLINTNCESISTHGDYIQLDYGTGNVCAFWYFICQKPFADSTIEKDTKLGVTFLRNNVRIGSACAL